MCREVYICMGIQNEETSKHNTQQSSKSQQKPCCRPSDHVFQPWVFGNIKSSRISIVSIVQESDYCGESPVLFASFFSFLVQRSTTFSISSVTLGDKISTTDKEWKPISGCQVCYCTVLRLPGGFYIWLRSHLQDQDAGDQGANMEGILPAFVFNKALK